MSEVKFKAGDYVRVAGMDHYSGSRGIIKGVSKLNHNITCYVIKVTELYPKLSYNFSTPKEELTIAWYNLESDLHVVREERFQKLLDE